MHSEHRTAICAIYPDLNVSGEVESVMLLIMDISEVKCIEVSTMKYASPARYAWGVARGTGSAPFT